MASRPTNTKATGWVLGTVLLGLLLAAAAWFFAISPVLDQAEESRANAAAIRDSNEILEVKIARLAEQYANIEEYRAELAALQTQVPTEAQIEAYLREVDALAVANGVTVTAVATTLGQTFVLPEVVQAAIPPPDDPAAAPTAAPTGEGEVPGDGTPTAPPAPDPASEVPAGFVAIPISVAVLGPYENVVAFLGQLQTGTQRLFLVTGLIGDAQDEAASSGGRPATVVGDIELTVSGLTYVLMAPGVVGGDVAEGGELPEDVIPTTSLPGAVPGKNPLVPVGGTPEP